MKKEKFLIGRKDKLDFPDLNLYDIDVKIDTGAHSSSIHCHNIKLVKGLKSNKRKVKFNLLDPEHPQYDHRLYTLPLYAKRRIKSSSGEAEQRYIIKTKVLIFNKEFDIELSLTDRSRMEFPILIGRKLLRNGFIVDVNKYDLSYKNKLK